MANNNNTYRILLLILLPLLTFSLGFGASQLTVKSNVVENTVRLNSVENDVDRILDSIEKVVEQNTELIAYLKANSNK